MKMMRHFEQFLETKIEGFFNRKMASRMQPAELVLALARRMEEEAQQGLAPHCFRVELAAREFAQLTAPAASMPAGLEAWLAGRLQQEAKERGLLLGQSPQVTVAAAETVAEGTFSLVTEQWPPQADPGDTGDGCTRVFQPLPSAFGLPPEKKQGVEAFFRVQEGADAGEVFGCTLGRMNMGRRLQNEIPLHDRNASRLHAYVQWEDGRHVLYDAKSLNGTFVNGHRIVRQVLEAADLVRIGHTLLQYEVKHHGR